MSIETLLTLGVTVGLLVLAAVLRLVVLGAMAVARAVTGHPSRSGDDVRARWSERATRLLDGVGAATVFVLASAAGHLRTALTKLRTTDTAGVGRAQSLPRRL